MLGRNPQVAVNLPSPTRIGHATTERANIGSGSHYESPSSVVFRTHSPYLYRMVSIELKTPAKGLCLPY